jgi:hypothetical protein
MAVLSGVSSSAVLRLSKTFQHISKNPIYERYLALEKVMASEKSFSEYRQALRAAELPCIPYLGVFLRDILYIEEGNKEMFSDGFLNLSKFLQLGDILLTIQGFQLR